MNLRQLRSKLSQSSLTNISSYLKSNLRLKINKFKSSSKKSKRTKNKLPLLIWETNKKHLSALSRPKSLKKLTESPKNLPQNTRLSSKYWRSITKLKWMNSKNLLQTRLEKKFLLTNNRSSVLTIPLSKGAKNLKSNRLPLRHLKLKRKENRFLRFCRNPPFA